MNIVILGLARSGTTALFYKIKQSLPPQTICLFEPHAFDARVTRRTIGSFLTGRRKPDVLAKVLPFRPAEPADADSFAHFEKQILIVRDPRDRIVSRLLYGIYDSNFCQDDRKVSEFVQLLEDKESDPHAMSLKNLIAAFAALNGEDGSLDTWARSHRLHSIQKPLDFHKQRSGLFVYKYEDMIDHRLDHLEQYLETKLEVTTSVGAELNRVTRTKNYGAWRNWFTPEDVEYFQPILRPYLDRYYPQSDWELSRFPTISPDHGSLYIARIVNDRRALMKLPAFTRS